jgi:hypothetical protein
VRTAVFADARDDHVPRFGEERFQARGRRHVSSLWPRQPGK